MTVHSHAFVIAIPLLWFRRVGSTAPDGPAGLGEVSYGVFRSELARAGDRLHLMDGEIVHEGREGMSRGCLSLARFGDPVTGEAMAVFELARMAAAGHLTRVPTYSSPVLPDVPEAVYPATHAGIERRDVSPAFAAMMEETEGFRHECEEEGTWSVRCSDYGDQRTVKLELVDPETGLTALSVTVDPISDAAIVEGCDAALSGCLLSSLCNPAKSGSSKVAWPRDGWHLLGQLATGGPSNAPALSAGAGF